MALTPDSNINSTVSDVATMAMVIAGGWDGNKHLTSIEIIVPPQSQAGMAEAETEEIRVDGQCRKSTFKKQCEDTDVRRPKSQESKQADSAVAGSAAHKSESRRADFCDVGWGGVQTHLLSQHLQVLALNSVVKELLEEQQVRRIISAWECLSSLLLVEFVERQKEQQRKAHLQRLAENIAADLAAARAESESDFAQMIRQPRQFADKEQDAYSASGNANGNIVSPVKEKVQVLEQCMETCIAEHHILSRCLQLDLSDDEDNGTRRSTNSICGDSGVSVVTALTSKQEGQDGSNGIPHVALQTPFEELSPSTSPYIFGVDLSHDRYIIWLQT